MNPAPDHFELFGLPQQFAVDRAELDECYRELQRTVHPDRYATAGAAERRASMQLATRVNEAYKTLREPLARGRYLLGLHGVDPETESNTSMPAGFLMEQMELREAIEDAAGDPDRLDRIDIRLRAELEGAYAAMGGELDRAEHKRAAETLRKLMFLEKLREELGDAMERLDA
ncbi:MAG: Fe-S protein assembly co-chaperone HscB [Betaproteobacteria bacterium]|nr:Fe-S protein assembly co-chaperone HscB [Betaproteobacteria bacterium]